MKLLFFLAFLFSFSIAALSQSRINIDVEKYKYPENSVGAKLISVEALKYITEQQILEALPDIDFYHDSLIRESLKCIALYRFKMNFFRKGEKGILDIDSHFTKISFEMKLILNNAQPGDIVQFNYIQCVRTDYEYRKRSGVIFKVVE